MKFFLPIVWVLHIVALGLRMDQSNPINNILSDMDRVLT